MRAQEWVYSYTTSFKFTPVSFVNLEELSTFAIVFLIPLHRLWWVWGCPLLPWSGLRPYKCPMPIQQFYLRAAARGLFPNVLSPRPHNGMRLQRSRKDTTRTGRFSWTNGNDQCEIHVADTKLSIDPVPCNIFATTVYFMRLWCKPSNQLLDAYAWLLVQAFNNDELQFRCTIRQILIPQLRLYNEPNQYIFSRIDDGNPSCYIHLYIHALFSAYA
jgi:hypothetical protein